MLVISKEIEIDYGHTLPKHSGFCSQIHGHRGRIVAYVMGDLEQDSSSSSCGMVLDFSILKTLLMEEIHESLDHGFAVWSEDIEDLEFIQTRNTKVLITEMPPTAEYLAAWAFKKLEKALRKLEPRLVLIKLDWWETPKSLASYRSETSHPE